jgi:hypothetical protein
MQQVAGGAGDVGDDGAVATGQGVEQRALAGIGRPHDHRVQALAQPAAAFCRTQQFVQRRGGRSQSRTQLGAAERVDGFIGEIDRRLDVDADRQQLIRQRFNAARELTIEGAACRACSAGIGGGDQVGDRLGLRKVEATFQERTFAEFAGAGAAARRVRRSGPPVPAAPPDYRAPAARARPRRCSWPARRSTGRCRHRWSRRARR